MARSKASVTIAFIRAHRALMDSVYLWPVMTGIWEAPCEFDEARAVFLVIPPTANIGKRCQFVSCL